MVSNRIPVKGIYSAGLKQMRLIGVIDMEPEHCYSDDGPCLPEDNRFASRNVFKTKIRRVFQFIGPYDETTGLFTGLYRDTVSGMAPEPITVEGAFRISQIDGDETSIAGAGLTLAPSEQAGVTVTFPSIDDIIGYNEKDIKDYCGSSSPVEFSTDADFLDYAVGYTSDTRKFKDVTRFDSLIDTFLGMLDSGGAAEGQLTMNEFMKGKIVPCEDGESENCLDEAMVRCGLALYRRAILRGWINPTDLQWTDELHTLFCSSTDPSSDCNVTEEEDVSPAQVALQEHNRFYKDLTSAIGFASHERFERCVLRYVSEWLWELPGQDSAFSKKQEKLSSALIITMLWERSFRPYPGK